MSGSGAGASHADIEPASKGATAATGATHVDTVAATGATHAGTGAAPAGAGATPKDTRAFPAGARVSPVNAGNVNNARPGGSTGSLFEVGSGGTVDTLVQALNSVGASPKDVIAVLQALRSAGSLLAEIEIL
ncbi:MAG TPA: flagellar basal body P-ring protein FlgI [Firmicutes bacterium]|nr:flagellar basal body P-ring protein FlgI [Bacillota bacterium]